MKRWQHYSAKISLYFGEVSMKVALIEPVGGHGGMNFYDLGLARGLVNSGIKVYWYTCDKTFECSENGIDIEISFRDIYGKSNKFVRFTRFFVGLMKSLRMAKIESIDIVHYHFFGFGGLEFLMCFAAKLFRFPVCITAHDVESFATKGHGIFRNALFSFVDKFIVHNEVSRRELDSAVRSTGRNISISVICHGNYLSMVKRIDAKAARASIGIAKSDFVFLFFGQIKIVKGLDVLLKAFAQSDAVKKKLLLVVAGKVWKDDFSRYQELINFLGISERVHLDIRYILDEEVNAFYSAADCVVLPYKKIYQSGVLLMAMSYGIPVLASDLDGMAEVIQDGKNGFLFKSEDVDSLSSKIKYVVENADLRKVVSEAALVTIKGGYDWNHIGSDTKRVYEAMI